VYCTIVKKLFDAFFSSQIVPLDKPRQPSFAAIYRVCSQKPKILSKLWLRSTVCIRGSLVKERLHSDSTTNKIIGKSQRKNSTFYVFTPWLFFVFCRNRGRSVKEFFHKTKSKN
jgi:hypothetical protein